MTTAAVTMTLGNGSDPPELGPPELSTIAPPEPAPGTPLGSLYVLDSAVGSGASGRVYRGRRREDDAPVAVKVLRGDFTADPVAVARFVRQRTVLHALDHPHLVRVHDLVAEGNVLAIVMDLIDGKDLRRLVTEGALRVDQRLTVLGQVAEALAAVHAADVVHRDIKPENVLVTESAAEAAWLHADRAGHEIRATLPPLHRLRAALTARPLLAVILQFVSTRTARSRRLWATRVAGR